MLISELAIIILSILELEIGMLLILELTNWQLSIPNDKYTEIFAVCYVFSMNIVVKIKWMFLKLISGNIVCQRVCYIYTISKQICVCICLVANHMRTFFFFLTVWCDKHTQAYYILQL